MKCKWIACSLAFLFVFTGCSPGELISKKIEKKLNKQSLSDPDYKKYLDLKADGKINDEGRYFEDGSEDMLLPDAKGKVHVTFAENAYLHTVYYADAALTQPIDTAACYLEAGDCIYASEPTVRDGCNPAYHFESFRIWKYDENGKRQGELHADSTEDHLVLQIPMDAALTELSVEPFGGYDARTLTLEDYYLTESGTRQNIAGTWVILGESYTGDTAKISAIAPFTVTYRYNADEYFFLRSKPECFSEDTANGEVYFHKTADLYEDDHYSVELHPYLIADIGTGEADIRAVYVNNVKAAWPCKLKYGDIIAIETDADHRVICSQGELSEPERLDHGYRFTMQITDDLDVSALRFESRAWGQKEIPFTVPQANIWEKMIGLFSDKAEDTLLTVRTGEKVLTYKDLKNGRTVKLNESEKLEIIVGEEIKDAPHIAFLVSVNGANPICITKSTPQKSIQLAYDDVESVEISVEKGYVFSTANIDNGTLTVQYLLDGKTPIKEGEFLPEGTQVTVKVTNIPQGVEISGGAVESGMLTGLVTITEKTRSSDFVVNCRSTEN